MRLIPNFLGKRQEAPFRQLSLEEITQKLTAQSLQLRGTPLGNPPHILNNESSTYVAGGIEVTKIHTGLWETPILGEFTYHQTGLGPSIGVYLPLGSYGSGGRTIDRRLVEVLHDIGALRSGLDSLPKTHDNSTGRSLRNTVYVTINPEGRLDPPFVPR